MKPTPRSYYPLFCTVSQTGQVLDVLHRSGNVHDSHGVKDFILRCIAVVRAALPEISIEVRMDSAFFSDEIVGSLPITLRWLRLFGQPPGWIELMDGLGINRGGGAEFDGTCARP